MAKVAKKVADRFAKTVGAFQRVLADAKDRDVNESDTVTIITDILSDVLGYDKYSDITSEQAIRGTYCDLAVKHDGKAKFLIEVKAIGLTLRENHLRQAVNYGANQGIPWVVLTNGLRWEIYRIKFEQPIAHEVVCAFDFLDLSPRKVDMSITNVIPHPLYHGNVPILIVNIISSLLFWALVPAQTFHKHFFRSECSPCSESQSIAA